MSYIVKKYGETSIVWLINRLKNGEDFRTAFQEITKVSITELESEWRKQFQAGIINIFMAIFTQQNIFLMIGILAVVAFFIMRDRYKRRLKEMGEEDDYIET